MSTDATSSRPKSPRRYRQVQITIWADDDQARTVQDQVVALLCPDPDHSPPCPIPWDVSSIDLEDDDPALARLRPQVEAEYGG